MNGMEEKRGNFSWRREGLCMLVVVAAAAAAYANTLYVPFYLDDGIYIVDNRLVRDLSNFTDLSGARYVALLSFALNYAAGGYDPLGYHLVNIVIHVANGCLLFLLVTTVLAPGVMRGPSLPGRDVEEDGSVLFVATAAALLFVLHPVQTQAVTYITQRFASLATLFYLLTVLLYIRAAASGGGRVFSKPSYWAALVSALLAMKTKEISFTLPLTLVAWEFLFARIDRGDGVVVRLKRLAPFLLLLPVIPLTVLGPELGLGGGVGVGEDTRGFQLADMKAASPYAYFMTQMRVIVTYIRLLFLPVGQNLDYDYAMSGSFFELPVVASFLLLAFVAAAAVYLYRKGEGPLTARLVPFGVLWFFLALSVESGVVPIKDLIFEHRMYLPSVGAFMAAASFMAYLANRFGRRIGQRRLFVIVVVVVALPLAFLTIKRNALWADEVAFWQDVVVKSPMKARGHNNLGSAYYRRAMYEEARGELVKAVALDHGFADAYYNLGLAEVRLGRLDEGIRRFEEAIRIAPNLARPLVNLAMAYAQKGRLARSIETFERALSLNPAQVEAYTGLANVYLLLGRPEESVKRLMAALHLDPASEAAHYTMGIAYKRLGMMGEARGSFETVLRLDPSDEGAARLLRSLGPR